MRVSRWKRNKNGMEWNGKSSGAFTIIPQSRKEKKKHAPAFIPDKFLNGESKSIATMPMLNTCTPPPDMYNMNACMGNDLSGEVANSQAFFIFRASCELSTCAAEDLPLPPPPVLLLGDAL